MLKAWAEFVQEPEPISQTVEEVTEMPAQTYHEWAIDYAKVFS